MDEDSRARDHDDRPPPPPEPSADATLESLDASFTSRSNEALIVGSEEWDITSVSGLGALKMLITALQMLADSTGDVPPTPPVSRPATPKRLGENRERRDSSPQRAEGICIGSPEAHRDEPIALDIGAHAEDIDVQRIAIARRFFSKTAPPFSVSEYLLRFHHFCPHSPGVYLTAALYIHRLCVLEMLVPATNRTIHRLSLASIRVAAKALEDNKWRQERVANVGGVSRTQLMNLEVTLCFLLDFELGIDACALARATYRLQQAAKHAQNRLSEGLRLRLPLRKKTNS